jgi:hypothetical protein
MLLFAKMDSHVNMLADRGRLYHCSLSVEKQTHEFLAIITILLSAGTLLYAFWGLAMLKI